MAPEIHVEARAEIVVLATDVVQELIRFGQPPDSEMALACAPLSRLDLAQRSRHLNNLGLVLEADVHTFNASGLNASRRLNDLLAADAAFYLPDFGAHLDLDA